MDTFQMVVTWLLYFASMWFSIAFLVKPADSAARNARNLLTAGFASHTIAILFLHLHQHFPAKDAAGVLAVFSWLLVGFFLAFQWRFHLPILGAFATPVIGLVVLASIVHLHRGSGVLGPLYRTPYFPIHVVLSFLGDASFALAACVGVMYLIQEKNVKKKHTGATYKRLPPLEMLDRLNHWMVAIGFPLLTLGMIVGMIWLHGATKEDLPKGVDPMMLWAILTWVIYAILMYGRFILGWRGRRAATLSVVGFGLVLFSFAVKSWLTVGLHGLA